MTRCNLCPQEALPSPEGEPPLCKSCTDLLANEEYCRNLFTAFFRLHLANLKHPQPDLAARAFDEALKEKARSGSPRSR